MKNKKLVVPVIAFVFAVAVMYASTQVSAFGFGPKNDTVITKLAEAFGKSEDEVRAVFDNLREEREAEMQQAFEEQLAEAVANGEITEEQKQMILDKHAEIRLMHEEELDNQDELTREERKAQMQAQHDELETWAEENGIDLSYFFMGHNGMGGHRGGRGMHEGMKMGWH